MKFTVGGRTLELSAKEVRAKMRDLSPEPIREHVVEVGAKGFPPKQVLAELTGWERQSFTTMEAQRVLSRLGFDCHRAGEGGGGGGWAAAPGPSGDGPGHLEARVTLLEASVETLLLANAGLKARLETLEGSA
jgi:hypothetical protein